MSADEKLLLCFFFVFSLISNAAIADQLNTAHNRSNLTELVREATQELTVRANDVDLRLTLAVHLSWLHRYSEARDHALAVIAAAPRYWDAHILLARIDAWNGRYQDAHVRLHRILQIIPDNVEALMLAADVGLWSKRLDESERIVKHLLTIRPSADLHYKLAQISAGRMDPRKIREHANRALVLDPDHHQARALRDQTVIAKFYSTLRTGYFTNVPTNDKHTYGQTIAVSFLPRARLGTLLRYDYDRRWSTNNHRIGARLSYRANEKLSLSTWIQGGNASVLPKWSADIGAELRLTPTSTIEGRYRWDRMKWPGTLHRGFLSFRSQITPAVHTQAKVFGGLLRHCEENGIIQGAMVSAGWTHQRFEIGARYGIGSELERPPLPAYWDGRLNSDFCLENVGSIRVGSPVDLDKTRAHDLGSIGSVRFGKTKVGAGYGIQLRFDQSKVHLLHLSLQRSL